MPITKMPGTKGGYRATYGGVTRNFKTRNAAEKLATKYKVQKTRKLSKKYLTCGIKHPLVPVALVVPDGRTNWIENNAKGVPTAAWGNLSFRKPGQPFTKNSWTAGKTPRPRIWKPENTTG